MLRPCHSPRPQHFLPRDGVQRLRMQPRHEQVWGAQSMNDERFRNSAARGLSFLYIICALLQSIVVILLLDPGIGFFNLVYYLFLGGLLGLSRRRQI
jgi:hypothetical protein